MSPYMQAAADLIGLALLLTFRLVPIVGCAYLVFWRGASGWWFIPAVLIAYGVTGKINVGAAP